MRRMATVIGGVVLVMLVMSPALGKGPSGVTIDGPGIAEPITIEGNGEYAGGSEFGRFVELSGFWQLVFGADPKGSGLGIRPEPEPKHLGVRYAVSWHLGGARIPASVYPDAPGGPWVHVVPGLGVEGFDTVTVGGWFAAPAELSAMLHEYRTAIAVADETAPAPFPRAATEGADRAHDPMVDNQEPPADIALARSARAPTSGGEFDGRGLPMVPLAAAAALTIVSAWWWRRHRALR